MTLGVAPPRVPASVYEIGECTWLGAYRILHDLGMPNWSPSYGGGWWGNANAWTGAAQHAGVLVDTNPTAGAILCAQAGWGGAGGVGHVAVVLDPSVGSDGKVAIEQCNWNYCLCYSHGRFAARGAGIRFIHIGQLAGATPPPPQQLPPPPPQQLPPPPHETCPPGYTLVGANCVHNSGGPSGLLVAGVLVGGVAGIAALKAHQQGVPYGQYVS